VYLGLLADRWREEGWTQAEIRSALGAAVVPDEQGPLAAKPASKAELQNFRAAAEWLRTEEARLAKSANQSAEKIFRKLGPATDRANDLRKSVRSQGCDPRWDPDYLEAGALAIELDVRYRECFAAAPVGIRRRLLERNPPEKIVRDDGQLVGVSADQARLAEAAKFRQRAKELRSTEKPPAQLTRKRVDPATTRAPGFDAFA
jgi:hypothetical protein